jgi:8-oxo-dGTP pyrophosphatase MutT (NUDIX family)
MNWITPIKEYLTCCEQEVKDKDSIIKCFETFEDILTRDNSIAHVTSSAFVVNHNRDKVLMVYHNIFDSWSWTGGHADGDENLLQVAMKEVQEETGIKSAIPVSNDILSLDMIPVRGHRKNGVYVSPHLHISIAYLLEADEKEPLVIKPDENSGVQWIPVTEIETYSSEPHMKKIYRKAINKFVSIIT